jgi:hypothetical protein
MSYSAVPRPRGRSSLGADSYYSGGYNPSAPVAPKVPANCHKVSAPEPKACWETGEGFSDCMNAQLVVAQRDCSGSAWRDGMYCSYDDCVQQVRRENQAKKCSKVFCDTGCTVSSQCGRGFVCKGATVLASGFTQPGTCVASSTVLDVKTAEAKDKANQLAVSDATKYPWNVKSAATADLQTRTNAAGEARWKQGLTKGYCKITVDGKLGAGTCGAAKASGLATPTTCKEFATDCRGVFTGDTKVVVKPTPVNPPYNPPYNPPSPPVDPEPTPPPPPIYIEKKNQYALVIGIVSGIVGAIMKARGF